MKENNMNNISDDLVQIIQRSSESLSESLKYFWPSIGGNEITERNISLYLGEKLINAGYLIFAEVPFPETPANHIDLLAINFDKKVVIAIECKRIHDSNKAKETYNDIKRIESFNILKSGLKKDLNSYEYYGIIVASTWKENISTWWKPEIYQTPQGFRFKEPWECLSQTFKNKETTKCIGSILLQHKHPKWEKHWLLYAVLFFGTK